MRKRKNKQTNKQAIKQTNKTKTKQTRNKMIKYCFRHIERANARANHNF